MFTRLLNFLIMTNILRHSGSNIGGVNPIFYALVEDINLVTFDKTTFEGTATLKTGKTWSYLYGTDESIQIEAEEQETPSGIKYVYRIRLLIPKDRSSVEIQLKNLNGRGLIVKSQDKNGITRLFGTIENPMRKLGKRLWPAKVEDFNGWEVILFGEFSNPAGYVDVSSALVMPE